MTGMKSCLLPVGMSLICPRPLAWCISEHNWPEGTSCYFRMTALYARALNFLSNQHQIFLKRRSFLSKCSLGASLLFIESHRPIGEVVEKIHSDRTLCGTALRIF